MEELTKEVHLDITVDENDLIKGATEVVKSIRPNWPVDQFQFKVILNTINNKRKEKKKFLLTKSRLQFDKNRSIL